jgi:hypothetical protein
VTKTAITSRGKERLTLAVLSSIAIALCLTWHRGATKTIALFFVLLLGYGISFLIARLFSSMLRNQLPVDEGEQ